MCIFLPIILSIITINNTIPLSISSTQLCLRSWRAEVGAALEGLISLGLAAALQQVTAPLAVAVCPVLAGGGGVTSHTWAMSKKILKEHIFRLTHRSATMTWRGWFCKHCCSWKIPPPRARSPHQGCSWCCQDSNCLHPRRAKWRAWGTRYGGRGEQFAESK